MSCNGQLDRFAEALFRHPFRGGVFKPRNHYQQTPADFLRSYSEHFEECCYSLCMGYHNAFLIAYFCSLPLEELSELLASLREDPFYYRFLKRAYFFIGREARSGCAPEELYVGTLRDSTEIRRDPATGREVHIPGRVLAERARASKVHIRHLTLDGENFYVPNIYAAPGSAYMPVSQVAECLRRVVEDWPQGSPS